jgi:N-acetylmuramoyl-L-alanine amidase-like
LQSRKISREQREIFIGAATLNLPPQSAEKHPAGVAENRRFIFLIFSATSAIFGGKMLFLESSIMQPIDMIPLPKRFSFIAVALSVAALNAPAAWPQQPLYQMHPAEIDSLLRMTSAAEPDFLHRLMIYSECAKGTPYRWFPLGEGAKGKYDRDPLIDFTHVDCLTFCEQTLAMALSQNADEMFQVLQRLRYRDGAIDIRSRNHFMIADWLPNNSWLVEDVTSAIDSELTTSMTKTIDRKAALRKLGVPSKELSAVPLPQSITVQYIPEENLLAIKDKLQGGEIGCVVQSRPGIIVAHLGFILRDGAGRVFYRNASARPGVKRVVDEDFDDLVKFLKRNPSWVGMIFLRVRPKFMNRPEVAARAMLKPVEGNGIK